MKLTDLSIRLLDVIAIDQDFTEVCCGVDFESRRRRNFDANGPEAGLNRQSSCGDAFTFRSPSVVEPEKLPLAPPTSISPPYSADAGTLVRPIVPVKTSREAERRQERQRLAVPSLRGARALC